MGWRDRRRRRVLVLLVLLLSKSCLGVHWEGVVDGDLEGEVAGLSSVLVIVLVMSHSAICV